MPHFLLKLIPPRPTFVQDMNEEEKNLMHQHAAYMKQLQEKNLLPVYGPVFDPKGSWGMGVIDAENESEVIKLMENDPTIIASLNTFEIYPMRAIIKEHLSI